MASVIIPGPEGRLEGKYQQINNANGIPKISFLGILRTTLNVSIVLSPASKEIIGHANIR